MPGSSVTHRLIAAGGGSNIAADQAAFRAAGVAGIQQPLGFGSLLDIDGPGARFHYRIHGVVIDFNNLIHLFHIQHDAAQDGNRAVGNAGAGAAGGNRHNIIVSQLHNSSHFFSAVDPHDYFRQVHQAGIRFFVGLKAVQGFRIGFHIGRTNYFC